MPISVCQSIFPEIAVTFRSSTPGMLPCIWTLVLFGSPTSAAIDGGRPGNTGAVPLRLPPVVAAAPGSAPTGGAITKLGAFETNWDAPASVFE